MLGPFEALKSQSHCFLGAVKAGSIAPYLLFDQIFMLRIQ